MSAVTIVEVAPRDGFQAVKPFIPTATKVACIEALAAAGFTRIEIGSFVSPKAIPQMADLGEILETARLPREVRPQVLVPNRKGLEMAIAVGVRDICWVVSVSESHNQNNVRRSVDQSLQDFGAAWRGLGAPNGLFLRFALATSFDCPFEGRTPEANVLGAIERALEVAPEVEIGLADTTGRAATDHVRRLFETVIGRYASPKVTFAYHGHDTYNLGVANALAAYAAGVRVFDAAAAGLGGCPFAPGATGNTASEDLVFAFEHMGVSTGIDFRKLLIAADLVYDLCPEQSGGRVRGVPRQRALSGFGGAARGLAA